MPRRRVVEITEAQVDEALATLPTDAQLDAVYEPGAPCPVCKSAMVLRSGRNGSFWACTAYPRCKTTRPAPPAKVIALPSSHPDRMKKLEDLIDERMRDLLSMSAEPLQLTKALEVAAAWQRMKWTRDDPDAWGSKLKGGTMDG